MWSVGDSPVPPVVSTTSYAVVDGLPQRDLDRVAVRDHDRPVHGEPHRRQPLDEHRPAAVRVHPDGGAVGRRDDQRPAHEPR